MAERETCRADEEDASTAQRWEWQGGEEWWQTREDAHRQPLPQLGQLLRVHTTATPTTTGRLYAVDPVTHHLALLDQVRNPALLVRCRNTHRTGHLGFGWGRH